MDHDGQRLVEFAAGCGQITDELVGFFTDDAAGGEVRKDALDQVRFLEQIECGLLVLVRQFDRFIFHGQGFLDLFVLQRFEFEQNLAEVAFDDFHVEAQFAGRFLDEHAAGPRRVQVERIDIERFVAANQHVDFQHVEGQVLLQAANAVRSVADQDDDFFLADFRFDLLRRGRHRRSDGRLLFVVAVASSRSRTRRRRRLRLAVKRLRRRFGLLGRRGFFFSCFVRGRARAVTRCAVGS